MKKIIQNKNRIRGLSLIELMIAVLIGLIVIAGLISVFDTSSMLIRTQNGLARIQENGRYTIASMKKQIEQTGYQYCMGESNMPKFEQQPQKIAWDFRQSSQLVNAIQGVGNNWVDPRVMIQGHECDATSCTPALNSFASDSLTSIPSIGSADGDRIAGTDVLTVRYLRGSGRMIENVAANVVSYTAQEQILHPSIATQPAVGSDVILVDCSASNTPPTVFPVQARAVNQLTLVSTNPPLTDPPQMMSSKNFARVFDTTNEFYTVTYYVLNNIVDGRSIPTLYRSINGVAQPIVQGVDDFDVLYGVKGEDGLMSYLTADQVQAYPPSNCWKIPQVPKGIPAGTFPPNALGCGWRSVVSVELHFLMNTIYNSSLGPVPFEYSQYGSGLMTEADIEATDIPHYFMHRKEFSTSIVLKNIMH